MADYQNRSVGLALGTSSVSIAVVQQHAPDLPEIIAFDQVKCRYLRDGMIVNLEALKDAINTCRKNIQSLVKSNFTSVTVNLCGVRLRNEFGTATLELKKKREVKKKHLRQILRTQLIQENSDWNLVHNLPESYGVDNQNELMSPIGMIGKHLSAEVQQIFAPQSIIDNLLHALHKCKLNVVNLVADPLSAAEALITEDEREIGICILDIGGSVIQMASIQGRKIRIPPPLFIGGDLVTSDIAIGLNTTIKDAERIKIEHGYALPELADDERKIHIPPLGGGQTDNPTSQHRLAEIIHSRMEEILEMVATTFLQLKLPGHYTSGVVLTGGESMLRGSVELAEKYLGMPVIEGNLRNISGLTDIAPVPLTSTAIGLALYGLRHPCEKKLTIPGQSRFKQLTRTAISWLGGDQ
ncbi:cell division protein FtsA [bacterium]|nr:cell division protein FtsA [bacterium]